MQLEPESRSSDRAGAIGGIAFAALMIVGVAANNLPRDPTDAELLGWWADRGNQSAAITSMYCLAVAGLAFLVFLVHLRRRLALDSRNTPLNTLVLTSGTVFVAMLFLAGAAEGAVATTLRHAKGPLPGADVLRYLPQIAFTALGVYGMLAAGLTIAATTLTSTRHGTLGRWITGIGSLGVVVVIVTSAAMAGQVAIPVVLLWTVAISIKMWRPVPTPATASTSTRHTGEENHQRATTPMTSATVATQAKAAP